MKIYDMIGIGFGPANLALAIAMQEQGKLNDNVCFIEKQPKFLWHGDMLLDNTTMQISFMKDLVTQRNPTSHFSFVNYLHNQNRLARFINLKTFYPSRLEFNDYLSWAASHFESHCHYGEQAVDITPIEDNGKVTHLCIVTRNSEGMKIERLAKNIVVSVGGMANITPPFDQIIEHDNVWHSSRYLAYKSKITQGDRVAVIGAGQSAAEIFVDVKNMAEQPQVDLIMRSMTLNPADSTPFVNEIFDPTFTDIVYQHSQQDKAKYFANYRQTNYSVVDEELISTIYNDLYQQSLTTDNRFEILSSTNIDAATIIDGKIQLKLSQKGQQARRQQYDHLIVATGYKYPSRPACLNPLSAWLKPSINRNYQIDTEENFQPKIFTQGVNENTHGISDSLLSILAVRSAEISQALKLT